MYSFLNLKINYYILFYYFIFILSLILLVAFFTLFERKILASFQLRKGPSVVGYNGFLQPISDALKLIFKKNLSNKHNNTLLFFISPFFIFFISLLSWAFIPLKNFFFENSFFNSSYSILWILSFSTFNSYFLFLAGFYSNSKYAFLGSIRGVIQFIAYEINLSLLIFPIIFLTGSFSLKSVYYHQYFINLPNFITVLPVSFLIILCFLAETNRAPFDLPEAEAELVAGYNLEYSSLPFAFFFLAEYLNIFQVSLLISFLLFSNFFYLTVPIFNIYPDLAFLYIFFDSYLTSFNVSYNYFEFFYSSYDINFLLYSIISGIYNFEKYFYFFFYFFFYYFFLLFFFIFDFLILFLIMFLFIWIRATFPRIRYDHLLILSWKYMLLISSTFCLFSVVFYCYFLLYFI